MSQDRLKKHIHFIGIGGIGMSALAQYYLSEGWEVSGSDARKSDITEMLKHVSVKVFIRKQKTQTAQSTNKTQSTKHKLQIFIKKADLVVYSAAVPEDDWQLKYAKKMGVKTLNYAEALGELTRKYKTICVSGTHGKSTTTAMLALIMIKAKLDPTVILGTKLKEFKMWGSQSPTYGSNFRKGKSEWLLIEADEFNASFLNYSPRMIVLTNIEEDHLDFYKDLDDIIRTFEKYIGNLSKDGVLTVNDDDENIQDLVLSLRGGAIATTKQSRMRTTRLLRCFTPRNDNLILGYSIKDRKDVPNLRKILKVPGEYNIYNAFAALAAARALKIPDKISFKALAEYKGAWRRMEVIGKYKGVEIISDYAHHPTEIKALLEALISNHKSQTTKSKQNTKYKIQNTNIMAVFQPHQQQRLEKLFDDFVKVLGEASYNLKLVTCNFIITDVYEVAGREKKQETRNKKQEIQIKNAKTLVDAINKKYPKANIVYAPKKKLKSYVEKQLSVVSGKRPSMAVFMGAGDIDNIARSFIHRQKC